MKITFSTIYKERNGRTQATFVYNDDLFVEVFDGPTRLSKERFLHIFVNRGVPGGYFAELANLEQDEAAAFIVSQGPLFKGE